MQKSKEYRIVSIDGSKIYQKTHVIGQGERQSLSVRTKKDKLNEAAFSGYLSRSLDTEKLLEIYPKYKSKLKCKDYKDVMERDENPILPLLVDVYFEFACREFNRFPSKQGARFVRFGYEIPECQWKDGCVFRTVDGKELLIGVEVTEEEDKPEEKKDEASEKSPKKRKKKKDIPDNRLPEEYGCYFRFEDGKYYRGKKEFPYVKEPSNEPGRQEMRAENIRVYLYREGFYLDGIHFVRYKRSAGSSRSGHCLFIAEPLYKGMMLWTRCGLPTDIGSRDVVSWEAYSALTLSEMAWPLTLPRKSILIMRDQTDSFEREVVCVSEKDGKLSSEEKTCKIENKIWDGEGLLDASCFRSLAEEYPHSKETPENRFEKCGMMLLRNRFFKTCAFRTRLQEWFRDNGITEVGQLNGYTEASDVGDIRMIVTESSIKYFKLSGVDGKSSDDRFRKVAAEYLSHLFGKSEETTFGVVKTDKPTHFMEGEMVRTSYQLLSTVGLTEDEVKRLYEPSKTYLKNIKSDPMYMRHYLNQIIREMPDFEAEGAEEESLESMEGGADNDGEKDEVSPDGCSAKAIMELLKYRDDFSRTKYYKDFRKSVQDSFRNRIRCGRILVNGTYATLFGNGAELLYAAIGKDYRADRSVFLNKDSIYTPKFTPGTRLLCARSPHITMGNLLLTTNSECNLYKKYFELSPEIVCVNAIGNNIQNRLNGCDYDSDTMLITDNPILVEAAERTYKEFPVPVCGMDSEKRTVKDLATVDNDIANNMIGEIVNLSQYLNAKYWDVRGSDSDYAKTLYHKICMLAVMSGMEIDKAKRHYPVKVAEELKRLGKEKENKPRFYAFITGNMKNAEDIRMKATMSYVFDECVDNERKEPETEISLKDLIAYPEKGDGNNEYRYANEIREAVKSYQKKINLISYRQRSKGGHSSEDTRKKKQEAFTACLDAVGKNMKNDSVLLTILKDLDGSGKDHDISGYHLLLFAFTVLEPNKLFVKRILDGTEELRNLARDEKNGTVEIYGHKHRIDLVPRKKAQIINHQEKSE